MRTEVITYSYLATLNNMNKHKDYLKLYKDLILNSIFNLSNTSKEFLIEDIRLEIIRSNSIDIPELMIDKIIKNYTNQDEILITNDGAVFLKNIVLDEYRELIKKASYEVTFLEEDYFGYLKANGIEEISSIYELVDIYKTEELELNNIDENASKKIIYQYEYLNIIDNDLEKKEMFKRILWGAVLTKCLINGNAMLNSFAGNILLLDTSFIVSLLGLHMEQSNRTCSQVIKISNELGFEYKIFDQTLEEAKNLILETADSLKEDTPIGSIFENDITRACYFNHKMTPTELERIANSIGDELKQVVNYKTEMIEKHRNKVENSDLYKFYLTQQKKDKISAFHDAAAIFYVENCRGGKFNDIGKSKCWFVQDKRNRTNTLMNNNGFVNERISSHDLLVMLWMNKPNVMDYVTISEIEYQKVLSKGLILDKPQLDIIKKFEENLVRYSSQEITKEEKARLRRKVVNMTCTQLEKIVDSDPVVFNENIREIIQQQMQSESDLVSSFKSEISERDKLVAEKNDEIEYITKEKEAVEERAQTMEIGLKEANEKAKALKQGLVNEKEVSIKNIEKLNQRKDILKVKMDSIGDKTRKFNIIIILICLVVLLFTTGYILYIAFYNNELWNSTESLLAAVTTFMLFIQFSILLYNKIFSKEIKGVIELLNYKYKVKLMNDSKHIYTDYEHINQEISDIENKIKSIDELIDS